MSPSRRQGTPHAAAARSTLRAAAAAVPIATTIAHEGELRACAVVLDAGVRLCLVSCDALIIPARVLKAVTEAVAAATPLQPEAHSALRDPFAPSPLHD